MSKPDDISQEAWDAASEAWEAMTHTVICRDAETEVIARAILAAKAEERESANRLLTDCEMTLEAVIYEYQRMGIFPGAVKIMQAQLDEIRNGEAKP